MPAASSSLSGTVVLVDGGVRNDRANGEFALYWTNAEGSSDFADVPVVDGAWKVELDDFAHGESMAFVLQGRPAFARRTADVEVRASHGQVLEVWATSVFRLHVLDAQTGAELPQVQVWIEHGGGERSSDGRPTIQSWMSHEETHGASPLVVEVDPESATTDAFVRAPGYAWKRIELTSFGGGERYVELSRGGDLVVLLIDPFPDVYSAELLTHEREPVAASEREWEADEGEQTDDRFEFANVPEGEYVLVFSGRGLLPRERGVSIVAGSSVTELVAAEPDGGEAWASIEGDLVVPESWWLEPGTNPERRPFSGLGGESGALELEIQHPLGLASPELGSDAETGTWTWSSRVAAGECTFWLGPSHYALELTVRDGDRVHLELPPLVEVLVSCRLPNGDAATVENIAWTHEAFRVSPWHPGASAEEPTVISMPVGRVSFWISDERLRITGEREFDIAADHQSIELGVRPVQGVDLAFRHGEALVVFGAAQDGVFAGSASVPIDYCSWEDNLLRLELAEAGPVTLTFSTRPDGFEPIADVVVDVPLGGFVEREVQLVPRR